MTEPEGFLTRWTRRKRDAARQDSESGGAERAPDSVEPSTTDEDPRAPATRDVAREQSAAENVEGESEPAFDLSKLPSIESITAETDIRPFLARGVPTDLRNAALRRAWVADPHIRDFIGIAENQGDFTGAGAEMAGFDFSPPDNVAKMIAEIFGERAKNESLGAEEAAADDDIANAETRRVEHVPEDHRNVNPVGAVGDIGSAEPLREEIGEGSSVRRTVIANEKEKDVATQNNDAPRDQKISVARRSHGGAMPK